MNRAGAALFATLAAAILVSAFPRTASAQDVAAHLGSFKTEAEGRAAWARIKAQHSGLLRSREVRFISTDVPGRGVWVRVLVPVADRNDANRLCQSLRSSDQYCVPMSGISVARQVPPPPPPAPGPKPQQVRVPTQAAPSVAPTAAPAPAPQRPATQAPEPITASVPLAPVEMPAPDPARPYFGTWARRAQDCNSRDMTIEAARVLLRSPDDWQTMACRIQVAKSQLALDCEDESRALFDVSNANEMVLRWVKEAGEAPPISSGAIWRRCAAGP